MVKPKIVSRKKIIPKHDGTLEGFRKAFPQFEFRIGKQTKKVQRRYGSNWCTVCKCARVYNSCSRCTTIVSKRRVPIYKPPTICECGTPKETCILHKPSTICECGINDRDCYKHNPVIEYLGLF